MKKLILANGILIIFLLTISFTSTSALNYTNKTFLMPRATSSLQYLERDSFHRLTKEGSDSKHAVGGALQISRFYRTSENSTDLGRYFGVNRSNQVTYGLATNYTAGGNILSSLPTSKDIDSHLLIHPIEFFSYPTNLAGTLTLKPKHTQDGFLVSYHHQFTNLDDKLFFKINFPIVTVKNDLRATATEVKDQNNKGILDYLSGNIDYSTTTTKQSPLTHAKIDGAQSKSGVADVTFSLGYKFIDKVDYQVHANLNVILPCGNEPEGKYLFEPVVGNGKHVGVGCDFLTSLNIFRKEETCCELVLAGNYTHLFSSDEKRTLGFRSSIIMDEDPVELLGFLTALTDDDDVAASLPDERWATVSTLTPHAYETAMVTQPWNHYLLGGQEGEKGTFPLANILTQNVSVSPGNSFCGSVNIAYHNKKFTADIGYSCFARDAEKISLKETWTNDTYAIAKASYDPRDNFEIMGHGDTGLNTDYVMSNLAISQANLNVNAAATPAIFTQTIHAGVAYILNHLEYPIIFGVGASYEWTQDNAAIKGYTIWGKAGVAF
jgi:hypothetical protein